MDVKPLHTIILNDEGISAVQQKIDIFTKKIVATKVTTKFLALTLTLNKRLCMGTICTPTQENIFMSEFKERYIYLLIKNKSSSYLRFIDDIFMVFL